jgi:hypothetical protein
VCSVYKAINSATCYTKHIINEEYEYYTELAGQEDKYKIQILNGRWPLLAGMRLTCSYKLLSNLFLITMGLHVHATGV